LVRLVLPHHDTPANAEEALILYEDIIRNIEDYVHKYMITK
jgi:hypothetical protein